jgi:hypothetical protein
VIKRLKYADHNAWSRRFDEPIDVPDGRKLRTLEETIAWLAKEIPKSEHTMSKVQAAARMVRGRHSKSVSSYLMIRGQVRELESFFR